MWDPRGRGKGGDLLAFADTEGYVGMFEKVYPSSEGGGGVEGVESDPLVDDSLLMEVCNQYLLPTYERERGSEGVRRGGEERGKEGVKRGGARRGGVRV